MQLTPAYTGGPTLADGAHIPLANTAVPVELDRIFSSLNNLDVALGPKGANKNGALSRLLKVGADNLDGEGANINQTVTDLSTALTTLANGKDDIFGTVRNLAVFTAALAKSDDQVGAFNTDLASVADQLAGERGELALALKNLAIALGEVASFVKENKANLTTDIKGLADITGTLAKQKDAIGEVLAAGPTALSNLNLAYNGSSGTLDTRDNAEQAQDPAAFLCELLTSAGSRRALHADRQGPRRAQVPQARQAGLLVEPVERARPDPRRHPRERAMMRTAGRRHGRRTRRRCRRPHRLPGRLRPPAAGRRRPGRRRLPRHGRVPRRARPGAAVGRQGQRRHGRRGRQDHPRRLARPGAPAAARLRQAAGQRRRGAAPDQPARREVRVPLAADRTRRRRAGWATATRSRCRGPGRNPEVEEVLGALSLVLNGGGVAQLKTINVELTKAMAGRESDIQGAIHQLDTFIGGLDQQKADIVRALDGLDHLSATLAAQKDDLADGHRQSRPRPEGAGRPAQALTAMLTALSDLGKVGTRVIRASKADTVANLKALQPTLTKLADAGANLPKALEMALTYPFPAAATGAVQRRLHEPADHGRPRPAQHHQQPQAERRTG